MKYPISRSHLSIDKFRAWSDVRVVYFASSLRIKYFFEYILSEFYTSKHSFIEKKIILFHPLVLKSSAV